MISMTEDESEEITPIKKSVMVKKIRNCCREPECCIITLGCSLFGIILFICILLFFAWI